MPEALLFLQCLANGRTQPRQRRFQSVIDEIVNLRRMGFRFIALADDNFYPVTLTDLRLAREQNNLAKLEQLTAIRAERFQLMEELAKLPRDMVFFTQITMEAGEDGEYLDAMRKANIKGALVGVEAVTPEGLKAMALNSFAKKLFRTMARVIPQCGMVSQAVAFNMFLAFFSSLLVVL